MIAGRAGPDHGGGHLLPARGLHPPAGPGPWDMPERERLIRAKAPELMAAGATIEREENYGEVLRHIVMRGPEGNEFCVA